MLESKIKKYVNSYAKDAIIRVYRLYLHNQNKYHF